MILKFMSLFYMSIVNETHVKKEESLMIREKAKQMKTSLRENKEL